MLTYTRATYDLPSASARVAFNSCARAQILVRVDERTNDVRLVFLDCGLVSELSDADNDNFQVRVECVW
jgi:hypothetical protein